MPSSWNSTSYIAQQRQKLLTSMVPSLSNRQYREICQGTSLTQRCFRCVYYCMEYMDAGSLDKLEGDGIPEGVLGRITGSMVRGLKFLKDDMQIIHRGTPFFLESDSDSF